MRKAHRHVRLSLYYDAVVSRDALHALLFPLFKLGRKLIRLFLLAVLLNQLMQHLPRGYAAVAYRGVYILNVVHVEPLEEIVIIAFLCQLAKLPALPLCGLAEHFLTADYVFLAVGLFEPLAYFGLGLLRFYNLQPVAARGCVGRGYYFANIVILQLVVKPYYRAVYLCMLNMVTNV